jgi:hypothetical protein
LGWFQQRPGAGWGAPWQITNAEYALAKFLDAALANEPAPRPTDPEGLGAWCQAVQRSAYPDAYAKKGYPMAAKLLGLAPEPKPEKLKPYQKTGWLKLDGLWQPERSGRPRVWGELGKDGTIKVRDW